jgi:type I restriction enzyme, R subunit
MNDMKRQKQTSAPGGLGRVHPLFGAELPKVIEELNRELVA